MNIYHAHIKGLVQGVGFRPFVYRIASELNLKGSVRNNNEGVFIEFAATNAQKELFFKRLQTEKPLAASIESVSINQSTGISHYQDFEIVQSDSYSRQITHVSPDIAVCQACLKDMKQQPTRYEYPFINCTHCGPRFSIIRRLPYDRAQTSMCSFNLCEQCFSEYLNIKDRRFHAQPIACNKCGPFYYLTKREGIHIEKQYCSSSHFFELLADIITQGEIISFKGLGGYNLICDALNPGAVSRLRKIKQREAKPFAIMFASIEAAQKYVELSETEKQLLLSWQRPIVISQKKYPFSAEINGGLNTVGAMLPYLPAHHLLFQRLKSDALIYTSGNLSDEPIITDNKQARQSLLIHTSIQADHDREIVNRVDDSIIQVINEKARIIRRSRGYVPTPLKTTLYTEGILAFGAEKVNTFAIGKENEILMSQYIGDLHHSATIGFYKETLERFRELFRFSPTTLCCDLHPDYYSSQIAEQIAKQQNLPLYKIQHQHAHAVACMEENHLTGHYLSIILDGTGYGIDGHIWGGEFLVCNHLDFTREAHFDYIPLPGGDKVTKEPWRSCIAYLEHYHLSLPESFLQKYENSIPILQKMIQQNINSPLSCGVGRLFDAVASLIGCCETAHFQAEAPLRLEHLALDNWRDRYDFDEQNPLNCCSLFENILFDLKKGIKKELIAAKFHNTLVAQLVQQTMISLKQTELAPQVILAGGCFQNKRLSEMLEKTLYQKGITAFVPQQYPTNDGGIALGQLSIAASLRNKKYA